MDTMKKRIRTDEPIDVLSEENLSSAESTTKSDDEPVSCSFGAQ